MICELSIENFALIKKETVDFDNGFNVLIGETGAGKSIIIKAISFLLGSRGDKQNIRTGEDCCKISASFFVEGDDLKTLFSDHEIEFDNNLVVSRTFFLNGRCEQRVNGTLISAAQLKEIGDHLLSSFAQHDSIALLDEKKHIKMLDQFCAKDVEPLKQQITTNLSELKLINADIKKIGGSIADRENRLDLLNFQIDEIEKAKLEVGEDEALKQKLELISSSEKIVEAVNQAKFLIDGGASGAYQNLCTASKLLSSVSKYDSKIEKAFNSVQSLGYDLCDISNQLEEMLSDFQIDNLEYEEIDERYDLIKSLKRKYNTDIDGINTYKENAIKERDELINSENRLKVLQKQKEEITTTLFKTSYELSNIRRKMAIKFKEQIEKELAELNMKNSSFIVSFSDLPNDAEGVNFDCDGFDKVKFLFTANIGSLERNLSKTISGGEMSRFMLALKNVLKSKSDSTFIFDEIDSGISGETANSVALKMANISKNNQIICISHLPQVCAMADNFILVEKFSKNGNTFSQTKKLQENEIAHALSRMAGGNSSEKSILYANELLEKSKLHKNSL